MKKLLFALVIGAFFIAGCSESKKSKAFLPAGDQSSSLYTQEGAVVTSNLPCNTKGVSHGDPHYCTFDGYYYSNQLIGEFVLARVPEANGFEVQVRQQRLKNANPGVTWNTAAAMRLGSHVIEYRADTNEILVDGTVITLAENKEYKLADGGIIRRNAGIVCRDAAGKIQVWVRDIGAYCNVTISAKGAFEGLLGNSDGSHTNDLMMRNGSQAKSVNIFAEDWRLKTAESLFTYPAGSNTNSYTENQDVTLNVTSENVDAARQACVAKFGEAMCTDAVIVAMATDLAAGAPENDVLGWFGEIKSYNDILSVFYSSGSTTMDFNLGLVPPFGGSDQTPDGVPESDLEITPPADGGDGGDGVGGGQVIVIGGDSGTPDGVIPAEDDGEAGPEGNACTYKGRSLVRHGKDACKVTGTWYRDANTLVTYQAGKAMAGFRFNDLAPGVYEVTIKARKWHKHAAPGALPAGFTQYKVALAADGASADISVPASATGFKSGKGTIDLAGGDTMIWVNWYNGLCAGSDCVNFQFHSIKLKKMKESKKSALTTSIYNIYKKNSGMMSVVYVALGGIVAAVVALTAVRTIRRRKEA